METKRKTSDTKWSERIIEFITRDCGIDIEKIKNLPSKDRARRLLSLITTKTGIEQFVNRPKMQLPKRNLQVRGIALIKPELILDKYLVIKKFASLGTDPIELPQIFLSHTQWMEIYAERIGSFPEIVYLYFPQRAFGMIPILFTYPKSNRYKGSTIDIAKEFNSSYCGHAYEKSLNTFRGEIVAQVLTKRGFLNMSNFALAFDPFKYFSRQSPRKIFGVFNGIHLPDNVQECTDNFVTVFGNDLSLRK